MKIAMLGGCLVAAFLAGTMVLAQEVKKEKAPVILLKMDDMCAIRAPKGKAVSPSWQKLIDFVEAKKIKANLGVIGFSLESDNQVYFDYLKELYKKGNFELWNHGYKNRNSQEDSAEFEKASVDEQKAVLEKTQKLAKEKLGIVLKGFGPHWSGTDENTEKALEQVPDIKYWLLHSPSMPKNSTKFLFERSLNLENPTFLPDFDNFKAEYEKYGYQKDYIVLQGHPNNWSGRLTNDEFEKIMNYLMEKGCVFMTFTEYCNSLKK